MGNEIQILKNHIAQWGVAGISICFIWAMICFGLDIFHFNLTIDEELVAFSTTPNLLWISQGRWASYVWNALVSPDGLAPIVPHVIAIVCLVASATLVSSMFVPANQKGAALLVAALFIANPVHVLLLSFSSAQYGLYIGLLFAVCSVVVATRTEGMKSVVVSGLLGAIALGSYQPYATLIIALYLGVIIRQLSIPEMHSLDDGPPARIRALLTRVAVSLIVAGLVYKTIDVLAVAVSNAPANASEIYQRDVFRFLLDFSAREKWLKNALYYYYWHGLGLEDRFVIFSYWFLFALAAAFILTRRISPLRRMLGFCVLVIFAFVPFALEIALAMPIPERSHVDFPAFVAIIASIALQFRNRTLKAVVVMSIAAVLLRTAIADNKLILAEQLTTQADRDEVNRIWEAIHRLEGLDALGKPIPLTFVGQLQRPANSLYRKVDVIGGSFLAWGENPWRVDAFMRTMGITEFRALGRDNWAKIKLKTTDMPVWPARGSVKIIDGVVTVRLGP